MYARTFQSLTLCFLISALPNFGAVPVAHQFIVMNLTWGASAGTMKEIREKFRSNTASPLQIGVGAIFSYLHHPRSKIERDLKEFLHAAEELELPIVIQLDGENWWGNRPDLWNWWDTTRPGYNPSNRFNVEWTGWSPENAVKIAWRNWGRQIRVLPPPNLMSPGFREACRQEMQALTPIILEWWKALPQEKKHLLIAVKVGWESSIGVNAWHYPNGNDLLTRPEKEDPTQGLNHDKLPGRNVATLGYAAAKSAGLRENGDLTEEDHATIIRRHLEDTCLTMAQLGIPRDKLFTHVAGWKDGENLYATAVNSNSCPGWSFYKYAPNPARDSGVSNALATSTAPYWAAVEWLYQGRPEVAAWEKALRNTLEYGNCKYVCIYNWEGIRDRPEAIQAIRKLSGSFADKK